MIIKYKHAKKKSNSESCIVWEYGFKKKDLGFALAKIDGRYPSNKKKAINTTCDMMYHVISGHGIIHTKSGDFEIEQGDAFFFEKGQWYWVEGKNLMVTISTSPEWYVDQYNELD